MPRIASIARKRPVRSSSVRCSLTDARSSRSPSATLPSVRAASVAIWRIHSFLVGHDPGSAGAPWVLAARAGLPPRVLPYLIEGFPPEGGAFRAGLARAAALADARRLAVAGV